MLDRLGEDRLRLIQVAPGIEHVVDLGPVLGPSGLTKFDERLLGSGKVGPKFVGGAS